MWYLQATPQQQTQVKQLFDNGQIEFVIGKQMIGILERIINYNIPTIRWYCDER